MIKRIFILCNKYLFARKYRSHGVNITYCKFQGKIQLITTCFYELTDRPYTFSHRKN